MNLKIKRNFLRRLKRKCSLYTLDKHFKVFTDNKIKLFERKKIM